MKKRLRQLATALQLTLLFLLLILITAPEWPAFGDERHQLNTLVGLRQFDFVLWELNALATKATATATNHHAYLNEDDRTQIVLDFVAVAGEIRALNRQLSRIYTDPAITDPQAASRDLQTELAQKRAELAHLQPTAEAILQEQVATVLVDEGFNLFDTVWPPVQMNMTPLPFILIVSPRDEIRQIYNVPLQHGLNTPQQDTLETEVYDTIDRSALVVPIGGLGIYPSMIVETGNINFLADVIAHEWAHHWLTLHPLGLSYGATPAMRTINETTASIIGEEVGAIVIERYYPDFVPDPPSPDPPAPAESDEPPAFDFRAEMAITRVRVDELLAEGSLDEAEAYMEERRLVFVANGYSIRKLNQAYFAFYGAYADTPGATGGDPIGPTVVAVREATPSLRVFLDSVKFITSFEDLQVVLTNLGG